MAAHLPVELELSDPADAARFPAARSFRLVPPGGDLPFAAAGTLVHLSCANLDAAEAARARGYVPEFAAADLRAAQEARCAGPARLALDPADPPEGLEGFLASGGSLRLLPRDARSGAVLLSRLAAPPERITFDASAVAVPPSCAGSERIGAACAAGLALLARPGVSIAMPGRGPLESYGAALETLSACGHAVPGVTLVSCPTCARASLDIVSLAERIHARTRSVTTPLRVAVMGCEVNGPGEARDCDLGVAGGRDRGLLFRSGEPLRTVPPGELESALIALIEEATGERCGEDGSI